ncbi:MULTISPECIES: glycosyltransferase family 39 protein [Dyella]|uniref:Glycosyltransferase family 39 protein n=2 Tax=Dyella TaxID=231454 RepID=A0A4R0YKW6_9GAMM|nr:MULTISPECIES: glycosyltransferase family 39 protein [Dyella]TBR36292.1 glycosyltransferase family 39 protein [Dyella terrae]TCI05949.1 glycosyltransferase family 39 protein [Dyella soli]
MPDPRGSVIPIVVIATLFGIAHMLTNGQYGFHRDEWQFLSDAQDLDWGFVPYPPLTAALELLGLKMFGLSLIGLRMFSVIAQSLVILASGLMARDLGGGRTAQIFAALAVGLSPVPMFEATEFQYSSFDMLWWVLIAWCVIRMLRDEEPRWWLAIGVLAGLGMQTKYSMAFFLVGVFVGVIATDARRHVASRWFWIGGVVAFLIFLPNLVWLIRHDFISYHFLQGIHARDVGQGRAHGFLRDQFLLNVNLFAAPVWLAGLYAYARDARYRMLAWMYGVPLLFMVLAQGRFYYICGVYPMLLSMGAVVCERWLRGQRAVSRKVITSVGFAGVIAIGIFAALRIVPIATSGPLRDYALKNNTDLREEIGWEELVTTVAAIRDALPVDQQAHLGIVVGNYGEYGSIALLGPRYRLPMPFTAVNTAWIRGYPTPSPTTNIVLGSSRERAEELFEGCRLAGHTANAWGVMNEESLDHPDIFVCGPARRPWSELWGHGPEFG